MNTHSSIRNPSSVVNLISIYLARLGRLRYDEILKESPEERKEKMIQRGKY